MLNICALQGRLAADPELKTTPTGVAVTSFTLAVDGYSKTEDRPTYWIDCVAWRGTAEFICKYFTKGQLMAVSGSLQTRQYEDRNGNKSKAVEVNVQEVSFCGSKAQSEPPAQPVQPAAFSQPAQPVAVERASEKPSFEQGSFSKAMEEYFDNNGVLPF